MTDFIVQHREATCFAAGVIFAIVVAILANFLTSKVWPTISGNAFGKWTIFACQVGFEIFLLQQWIHGYNAMYEADNPYNRYVLMPLIVTVPLFFVNILLGIGVIVWLDKSKA